MRLVRIYSQSQISLGIVEVHDRNDPSRELRRHIHLREFEAPMSGALYCTGYLDELTHFFEPGKEIVTYRNEEELLDRVRYLLSHPVQAEAIRLAGRRRALAEHTYHHRYLSLFDAIGLDYPCADRFVGTVIRTIRGGLMQFTDQVIAVLVAICATIPGSDSGIAAQSRLPRRTARTNHRIRP